MKIPTDIRKPVHRDLRPVYEDGLIDRIKECLQRKILPVVCVVAISTGTYFIGHYNGIKEGKKLGKEDIIISLAMHRYDAQQNAKYARSLAEQEKILSYAGSIHRVFELLDRSGHFKDVSDHVRKEAFPYGKR